MIVACGPESNGTRLLSRILVSTNEPVVHRSLPNGEEWWSPEDFPGAEFVVILRDIDWAVKSALRAGHVADEAAAYEEQRKARAILDGIPGAIRISYEDLVKRPKRVAAELSRALGKPVSIEEPIQDRNKPL
jgi:hypothetical protein